MAQQTDHNGMFIEGMLEPRELATFLKIKFNEAEIQESYHRLLKDAQALSHDQRITPLKAFWKLLDQAFSEKSDALQCDKGCAHCCHTGVAATQLEWDGILNAVREKGIDLDDVINKSRKSIDRIRNALKADKNLEQTDWHQLVMNQPCPFLNSDMQCIVYEDRPLDCRLVVAFREACSSKKLEHAQRGVWVEEAAGSTVIAKLQYDKTPKMKRRKFDGTQPIKLLQHWLILWQTKNKKKRKN